ncbi:hypothetical protein BJ166DRAFT_241714 [Pestalotiopsis sp. NC0098]|nr:hypothetical protein BJ166DRAFT_241714 [Pestalotiopsis sp. NC0098]
MAISVAFRAIVGLIALLATVAVVVLEIANAQTTRSTSTVQIAAAVATALEGLTLIVMVVLITMSFRHSTFYGPSKLGGVWFPVYVVAVVLATAASVAALVLVGQEKKPAEILGTSHMSYLIGTAVALGLAFIFQLSFVTVYFVGSRSQGDDGSHNVEGRFLPQMRMKSVPYSRTTERVNNTAEGCSFDMLSPPGSSGNDTLRSSLSHKVRPMDSKTRLLSTRSSQSIKSTASRRGRARGLSFETMPDVEEGFDSWDTSSVDTQNRQVLDSTTPPGADRFLGVLETIPASPTVSRSSSPYTGADIEPPSAAMHRSRSYSPVPRPPPVLHSNGSMGELHIHPLFRCDSPTPPPAATPGTSIVAAPEGSRTLSVKKITRMRSGSLPTASSPLSRQGSMDSMRSKVSTPNAGRLSPIPVEPEERQMTPPLPDWILNAGSRTSLTDYHLRKQREKDGTTDSGFESTF